MTHTLMHHPVFLSDVILNIFKGKKKRDQRTDVIMLTSLPPSFLSFFPLSTRTRAKKKKKIKNPPPPPQNRNKANKKIHWFMDWRGGGVLAVTPMNVDDGEGGVR